MRLWHKDLIPYLPDLQLKGQWRECVLIADALAKNSTPNHLLVNRVTEYSLDHFVTYGFFVFVEMRERGFNASNRTTKKIEDLGKFPVKEPLFPGWHNKEYLRVCMANLYEKHFFGVGKSRITDEEWETLCRGYKEITGLEYSIDDNRTEGIWMKPKNRIAAIICGACEELIDLDDGDDYKYWNYCPFCGAEMKEQDV